MLLQQDEGSVVARVPAFVFCWAGGNQNKVLTNAQTRLVSAPSMEHIVGCADCEGKALGKNEIVGCMEDVGDTVGPAVGVFVG